MRDMVAPYHEAFWVTLGGIAGTAATVQAAIAALAVRAQVAEWRDSIHHHHYFGTWRPQGVTADSRILFSNWAYCWRFKARKEQAEQRLTIDPHAPAEFRANIVRNLDEFHNAFATAEGDGLWLAPEDRVRIW